MSRIFRFLSDRPYILLLLVALFWSGNSIVGRAVIDAVPPLGLAFWRWFFAFLLLLPFAWKPMRDDLPLIKMEWKRIVLLGLVGITAFNTGLYIGLHTTHAINSGLIQTLMPLMVIVLVVFLGEFPSLSQLSGILLAFAGVIYMLFRGDMELMRHLAFTRGDLWILSAVFLYALYSVGLRWRPRLHPLSFLAATFAVGWISLLPLYLGETMLGHPMPFTAASIGAIFYVSIFPSILAYLFYNRAVEVLGAARAGVALYLVPVILSVLAIILLGETFHLYHGIGMLFIMGGIAIAEKTRTGKSL